MTMHNPPHPGEFIEEVYLIPFGLNASDLAAKLDTDPTTTAHLLKGKAPLTPEMALRLSKSLGRTPESWLALQNNYDLWQAKQTLNLDKVQSIQFEVA